MGQPAKRDLRLQRQVAAKVMMVQSDYHLPGDSAEIRALDAVVQRCLAKDSRDRYGSAAELAKDLVPTLARCGGSAAQQNVTMSDSPTRGERSTR